MTDDGRRWHDMGGQIEVPAEQIAVDDDRVAARAQRYGEGIAHGR